MGIKHVTWCLDKPMITNANYYYYYHYHYSICTTYSNLSEALSKTWLGGGDQGTMKTWLLHWKKTQPNK